MTTATKLWSLQPLSLLVPVLDPPRLNLEIVDLLTQIRHVLRCKRFTIPDRRQSHQHLVYIHVPFSVPASIRPFLLCNELVIS